MNEIYRGEIYYAELDGAKGSEQAGVRPVLIVQNNKGNKYSPCTIVAPLSTRMNKSKRVPTHVEVDGCGLVRKSIVLCEQLRTIDTTRLKEKVGTVGKETMEKIGIALKASLGIV